MALTADVAIGTPHMRGGSPALAPVRSGRNAEPLRLALCACGRVYEERLVCEPHVVEIAACVSIRCRNGAGMRLA
jgi:hypothetical protein